MPSTLAHRFIDPKVLSDIGSLQLLAKTVVEGFVSGMHRSPFHGFSLDFLEYREYSPGDDIRSIDWKVYARSDRFYVKKFEGDTNTRIHVLLDASKSMDFGSHSVTKLDYARYVAASIAYFAVRQNDAAGLLTFDSGIRRQLPPSTRPGHFFALLRELEQLEPGGETDISGVLEQLSAVIRKRSVVVLISDFYQEVGKLAKALRFFHFRGNDIILFHILDPLELNLPVSKSSTFEDVETRERVPYDPELSRQAYLDMLQSHLADLRKECSNHSIDYEVMNTAEPLDRALRRYMTVRSRQY